MRDSRILLGDLRIRAISLSLEAFDQLCRDATNPGLAEEYRGQSSLRSGGEKFRRVRNHAHAAADHASVRRGLHRPQLFDHEDRVIKCKARDPWIEGAELSSFEIGNRIPAFEVICVQRVDESLAPFDR